MPGLAASPGDPGGIAGRGATGGWKTLARSATTAPVDRIVRRAEALFGARVEKITAPGGRTRSSMRVHFATHTVIATFRPDTARTRHEETVLRALGEICDDVPRVLGRAGDILFQSDVGRERLSRRIQSADPGEADRLATEAVAAIFRIHRAARALALERRVPHLGAARGWVRNLVGGIDRLADLAGTARAGFDREAVGRSLTRPPRQFLKWDCRAGNAALGDDGRLRWFDFEYAGARHGAEDIAWLIGDELWPVEAGRMLEIVARLHDPEGGESTGAYLDYLHLYSVFHAIQRILLIVEEARRRGWRDRATVLRKDDVGLTPAIGLTITERAAGLARGRPETAPLAGVLAAVEAEFRRAQAG